MGILEPEDTFHRKIFKKATLQWVLCSYDFFLSFFLKLGVILMSPTCLSDLKYFLGVLSKSSYFYLLSAINLKV